MSCDKWFDYGIQKIAPSDASLCALLDTLSCSGMVLRRPDLPSPASHGLHGSFQGIPEGYDEGHRPGHHED